MGPGSHSSRPQQRGPWLTLEQTLAAFSQEFLPFFLEWHFMAFL